MTDFVATGHAVRTRSPAAFGGSFATIRTKLVDAWPLAMIAFGVVLTLVWSAGLFWLLLSLLLLLI